MRVTNNTVSESVVGQIQSLGAQQAKLQNQVSTGQRIFQASDDPAATGRVLDYQSELRKMSQFQTNAARALQLSQASFSGLKAIKTVADRATQIGTLGGGSVNPAQTQAYASEVNQLIEQTLQLTNSRLGNDYLYGGTSVSSAPFVATRNAQGQVVSVAYAGNASEAEIPLSETTTINPATRGATNVALGDFLNQLVALRDALNANDVSAINTAQGALVGSEDTLVSALAEHGGIQMRIEANREQQKDRAIELEKLVSSETDADLPSTIVKLTQAQTAYQAALQSAANIMRISLLDYIK